ncbi:MAG: toxin-antitoxin system YwqK family antitoxin [Dysgonomonas sp.]
MKKYNILILLLFVIVNVRCSDTVTIDKVTERDGIVYLNSTKKPFTGIVKEKATKDKEGYEGRFVKGEPEGTHKHFTENDSIVLERNFLDGQLHGSFVRNHINGTDVYNYKHGVKDGEQFEYYDHQRTKIRFYRNFKNGKVDGEMRDYYRNGNIEELKTFKDGMFHGEHTKYDENGTLRLKEYYVNDERDGLKMEFFKDGDLCISANYKNGKLHGKYIYYYSEGKKRIEIDYVEHKKHGKDIMYYEDGRINNIKIYEHGKEVKK